MISEIPVSNISPSPFQNRKHFDAKALEQLAESVRRDGLVEPIVVRPVSTGYELIAGERRVRAVRTFSEKILARVVEVDDLTARRMCAAENMQRADLSAVEEIYCLVEVVDSEMAGDADYMALGPSSLERVKALLVGLDSDARHGTDKFANKFVRKTSAIFSALPRPKEWVSFLKHDLPLITTIKEEVIEVAIANRLNKSQTKALAEVATTAPSIFQEMVDLAADSGAIELKDEHGDSVPLHEFSARDLKTVGLLGVDHLEQRRAVLEKLMTGDMEGYTPAEYVEAARRVMGSIDLDPASNELAQEVVKASVFHTARTNGLDKEWAGNVFLNPPYNAGLIDEFLDKLLAEYEAGRVSQAIVLTNNNTDTGWFHKTAKSAAAICLTRGRINFYKPDRSKVAPTNGQAFFYLGSDVKAFHSVFSDIGLVLVKL